MPPINIPINIQEKFLSELEIIVKKTKKIEIKKDQGWYSELEMKNDLKWASTLV